MTRATFPWDLPDGMQWEIEVTGEVIHHRGYRATYDSPAEPAYAEAHVDGLTLIHDGTAKCHRELDPDALPPGLLEQAEAALLDEDHENAMGAADRYADEQYDRWREAH